VVRPPGTKPSGSPRGHHRHCTPVTGPDEAGDERAKRKLPLEGVEAAWAVTSGVMGTRPDSRGLMTVSGVFPGAARASPASQPDVGAQLGQPLLTSAGAVVDLRSCSCSIRLRSRVLMASRSDGRGPLAEAGAAGGASVGTVLCLGRLPPGLRQTQQASDPLASGLTHSSWRAATCYAQGHPDAG